MKIEPVKIISNLQTAVQKGVPQIPVSKPAAQLNDACEKLLQAQGVSGKAQLLIQNRTQPHRLPLLFLPETLSTKEAHQKIWGFQSFIKRDLKPEQKIIKDSYSVADLLGKLYTADETVHSPEGYTDAIHDCISIILNNKKDAYMLHLSPGKHKKQTDIERMKDRISSFIDALSQDNQRCSAFLYGGQEGVSEKLHADILEALKSKGIKPDEVLFDKFGGGPHSIYYNVDKGIVLDNYSRFGLDDLKANFKLVNISPA